MPIKEINPRLIAIRKNIPRVKKHIPRKKNILYLGSSNLSCFLFFNIIRVIINPMVIKIESINIVNDINPFIFKPISLEISLIYKNCLREICTK